MNIDSTIEPKKPEKWYGVRYTQFILLFALLIVNYGMRVVLSLGIVAMTDPSLNPSFETYNWTDKSVVLSSFYWGYIVPQVVAGQISELFGAKWLLVTFVSAGSIATIAIPLVAHYGSWAVMICRIIQGFCQGPTFPCIHFLIGKWAPISELSRIAAFIYSGIHYSTALCNAISGTLISSSWGWPSLFYLYGTMGIVWTALWYHFGENSPNEHRSISNDEKLYIQYRKQNQNNEKSQKPPTPWREMLTSSAFLAVVIAHFVQNWGFVTLLTEIPSYLNKVLEFDTSTNGLVSALPYFVMGIVGFIYGAIFDYLYNKKIITMTLVRKIANGLGFVGPALALIVLGLIKVTATNVIVLLTITLGINAATNCGYQANHVDLSPRYSGTQMGITNTVGAVSSILGPLSVQYIVRQEQNSDQWSVVFYISAAIYIAGAIVYSFMASGETQKWDNGPTSKSKDDIS